MADTEFGLSPRGRKLATSSALGMATQQAMIRGGGKAADRGTLALRRVFRTLRDVCRVVLDKTGTLTRGEQAVIEVVALGGQDRQSTLRLAAAD